MKVEDVCGEQVVDAVLLENSSLIPFFAPPPASGDAGVFFASYGFLLGIAVEDEAPRVGAHVAGPVRRGAGGLNDDSRLVRALHLHTARVGSDTALANLERRHAG